jgi:two-component sensor histidine kinase
MTGPLDFRSRDSSALLLVVTLAAVSLYLTLRLAGVSPDLLAVSAFLVGAALGMRYRVYVLSQTAVVFASITVIVHLSSEHTGATSIMLNVLVVHVAHQIGYLFGVASFPYLLIARTGVLTLLQGLSIATNEIHNPPVGYGGEPNPDKRPNPDIDPNYRDPKHIGLASVDRPTSAIGLTPTGELLNAVENLARAVSTDTILEIIRANGRRLIGSDGVALILAEGDQCHYVEEDAVGPLWKNRKFKMTECISGWSMINKTTAVIADISSDPRIPYHLYADTFVKSLVMTPVGIDRPIGALGAYWASPYQPTDYEIETVKTLARSTATALENAKLVSMLSHSLAQAESSRDEFRCRADNAYLAVRSLAQLSLAPESAEVFSARIATLARTQEAVDRQLAMQGGIDIRELVRSELEVPGAETLGSVNVEGPSLLLGRAQATAFGLAVNELATNALKERAQFRLNVSWRVDRNYLMVEWREEHEPEVRSSTANARAGSRLLHRFIEDQLQGTVHHRFDHKHVICEIKFPLHEVSSPSDDAASTAPGLVST